MWNDVSMTARILPRTFPLIMLKSRVKRRKLSINLANINNENDMLRLKTNNGTKMNCNE